MEVPAQAPEAKRAGAWRLSSGWLFVMGAALAVLANKSGEWRSGAALWPWLPFCYALVSGELCLAIYIYGVGSLSPHWRPEAPKPGQGAAASLLQARGEDAGSHPLGPRMSVPVRSAAGEGAEKSIAVQAIVSERKVAGDPGAERRNG